MKLAGSAAQKFLRSPDPDVRCALLYGPNRSRVADATAALIAKLLGAKFDDFSLTKLTDDDIRRDKARLMDELAAQGLLGPAGPRVVRVRADGDSAADSLVAAAEALHGGAPAAAFLLVEGGDLAARSRIRAIFEKLNTAAAIAFYDDEPGDLANFAEALCREAKLDLAPGALEAALAALPNDRGVVRAEVEKLALFAHGLGRPVSLEEVLALASGEAEAALDDATRAALQGDAAHAVEALARGDAGGVSALKALERRMMRLMEAQALIGGGMPAGEALGKLKPPVFFKEKDATLAQLRVWSAGRLDAGLNLLWEAQRSAMQGGAPQDLIAAGAFRAVARLAKR